jgi:Protein of unknown function (DUF4238)
MPDNKNQHFVPKCHLRPFSCKSNGKSIHVFNIARKRVFENVSLKNQCAAGYFYGKDQIIETKLSTIEGRYSDVLRRIFKQNYVLTKEDKTFLLQFWALQYFRTEAAAKRSIEGAEMAREHHSFANAVDAPKMPDTVQLLFENYEKQLNSMTDLKGCFIRNQSKIPFITSDNPAILTNRWVLERRKKQESFALPNAGAIVFLPLSPDVLFVGYDGDVYSLPHQAQWILAKSERDVVAFNEHQFLSCTENVYYNGQIDESNLKAELAKALPTRAKPQFSSVYAVRDATKTHLECYRVISKLVAETHPTVLVQIKNERYPPTSWSSKIRYRSGGSVYSNGSAVGFVRKAWTSHPSARPFVKFKP